VKKYIPRSIQNIFDRVEAFNESITEKLFSEDLPTTFEVVVYTSLTPETRSPTPEPDEKRSESVSNYYFYSARSLAGHHDHLVKPESASTYDEYERLRNAHFQAIIKKSAERTPQQGEVWLATQNGGNLVTLNSFQRAEVIRLDLSVSDEAKKALGNTSDPTELLSDYSSAPETSAQADRKQYKSSSLSMNSPIPAVDAVQKKLLDFISKREGSYNASNNGTDPENKIRNSIAGTSYVAENFVTSSKKRSDQKLLSTMTLKEIISLQKGSNPYFNPNAGHKRTLFAVGAYQIIPETMFSAILSSGLSDSDVFNEDNQDKLGLALIYGGKRPALRDYLKGSNSVTLEQAQTDFALEWASVPLPSGKSAYAGTGNAAGHSSEEVQAVLKEVRELNIQNGFTI
jgi:hypothetical protein